MKVIKLNRRFKVYKEHGHQVAVKFDGYTKASDFEKVCWNRLGAQALWSTGGSTWYGWFGASRDGRAKPYFISLQKESDLTFVLMCLTNK